MLPMDFSMVLQSFATPSLLAVFDAQGEYRNGSWQEGEARKRIDPVLAIVLGMSPQDLELRKQGEAALGGIAVHTAETLYFTDVFDPSWEAADGPDDAWAAEAPQPGQENRQSYVEYMGRRYRIVGEARLFGNATSRLYHGVRYIA